ncbi:MAG: class I SAM-dependent methyltransferase [Aeromonadales bacterium]|nr:class I SAM-dependent methyltransferase [Aeromonadales bacterium]
MIKFEIDPDSALASKAKEVAELIATEGLKFESQEEMVVKVADEATIHFDNSMMGNCFCIDFTSQKLLWRLNHSGKSSEAVCRAVIGKLENPIVFDATAGLGRESLILQSAGAQVYMFERNPIIWLLLNSAINKAQNENAFVSSLKHGLPVLTQLGSIKTQLEKGNTIPAPDVIYYDPMFPSRTKSALVKKDMRVFHELIGADEDTLEYANYLCTVAKHHVVVKRPSNEEPLNLNIRRSSFVDGKACRFDCYYTNLDK